MKFLSKQCIDLVFLRDFRKTHMQLDATCLQGWKLSSRHRKLQHMLRKHSCLS